MLKVHSRCNLEAFEHLTLEGLEHLPVRFGAFGEDVSLKIVSCRSSDHSDMICISHRLYLLLFSTSGTYKTQHANLSRSEEFCHACRLD